MEVSKVAELLLSDVAIKGRAYLRKTQTICSVFGVGWEIQLFCPGMKIKSRSSYSRSSLCTENIFANYV